MPEGKDEMRRFINKQMTVLTKYCSAWFGHIHLPVGKDVSGGSRQS
jgi:hypothetical protein